MLKNPLKLTNSLSAQYYNIAHQFTFMYVCTYVRINVFHNFTHSKMQKTKLLIVS